MTVANRISEETIIQAQSLFVFGIEVVFRSSNLYIFSLALQYCSHLDRHGLAECVSVVELSNLDQITIYFNASDDDYNVIHSIGIDVFGEECLTLTNKSNHTISIPVSNWPEITCEYLLICNIEIDLSHGFLCHTLPLINFVHSMMITHPSLLGIMVKIDWQDREHPVILVREGLIMDRSEDYLPMLKALAEMSIGHGGSIIGDKGFDFGPWSYSDINRYYQLNLDQMENTEQFKPGNRDTNHNQTLNICKNDTSVLSTLFIFVINRIRTCWAKKDS